MKKFYDEILLMNTDYFTDKDSLKVTIENPDYFSIYMESMDEFKYNYAINGRHTLVEKQKDITFKTTFIDTFTNVYEADELDISIFSSNEIILIGFIFENNNFNIFKNASVEFSITKLKEILNNLPTDELPLEVIHMLLKLYSYRSEKYLNENHFEISTKIIEKLYIDDSEVEINHLGMDDLNSIIYGHSKIMIQISDQFISHIIHRYSNFINGNMMKLYKSRQAILLVNILQFNRFSQIEDERPNIRIDLMNQTEMRPLNFCNKLSVNKVEMENLLSQIKENESYPLIKKYSYSNNYFDIELMPISEEEKNLFNNSIDFSL